MKSKYERVFFDRFVADVAAKCNMPRARVEQVLQAIAPVVGEYSDSVLKTGIGKSFTVPGFATFVVKVADRHENWICPSTRKRVVVPRRVKISLKVSSKMVRRDEE